MNFKLLLVFLLAISVTGVFGFVSTTVAAQGQSTALERGYRTGYSDGYSAGSRDVTDRAARDYQNKEDYKSADRSYSESWGSIEDYRDGYRQGFEKGYAAGYEREQFNSALPAGFGRRGNAGPTNVDVNVSAPVTAPDNTTVATDNTDAPVTTQTGGAISIPRNTILALELITPVSTDVSQRGDRIQARVVEPAQYAGFIVEGRVAEVRRPGKVKGVGQLQLAFDQIRSTDHRTAPLRAELTEITPMGDQPQPEVDAEGGVKGRDSTKDDAAKVGAASGIGAIIGAIAGGGKGAAIGAIIGGGAGTAGVMTQRGKDVRLEQGQQLKIRTSTDTGVL
jgi:hypothetical protein